METVIPIMLHKNRGFTLIEVMMAILILMVGMIGLLQAINLTMEVNLRNQVREEAVYVGEKVMNEMRGRGFDNISVAAVPSQLCSYQTYQIPSRLRGINRTYDVTRSSRVLSMLDSKPATKELTVLVNWTYKGTTYENRVVAPISK